MVDEGLMTKLNRIQETLDIEGIKDVKGKKRNLPGKLTPKQMKDNYVILLLVNSNNNISPLKVPVVDGVYYVKERNSYHSISPSEILWFKKKPYVIQPEWSKIPYDPRRDFEMAVEENRLVYHEKVIKQLMERAASDLKQKSPLGGKWILIGLGGLVLVMIVLSKLKLFG